MDGESGDVVGLELDLACMESRPQTEAELSDSVTDRSGTPNRPSGSVEGR
jgi:hypothetical protein